MTELEPIHLDHDGANLVGQCATPDGDGPWPVVLVFPSALGLGDHVKDTVRDLAEAGFIGLGVDMYGDGVFSSYTDAGETGAKFQALTEEPTRLRSRVNAWVDKARTLPGADPRRIAAIGYCFGGMCVLELARSGADLAAVVSYHGILKTGQPAAAATLKAEVVAYCGAADPYAPLADIDGLRAELEAAGARYQIIAFGKVQHSFTDPRAVDVGREGIAYDAAAAAVSWAGTLALLRTRFG